jgi:hypothetical protein
MYDLYTLIVYYNMLVLVGEANAVSASDMHSYWFNSMWKAHKIGNGYCGRMYLLRKKFVKSAFMLAPTKTCLLPVPNFLKFLNMTLTNLITH